MGLTEYDFIAAYRRLRRLSVAWSYKEDPEAKFHIELVLAVAALGLTESDLTKQFGVSKLAARRWLSGESAPHPAMRYSVIRWLDDSLKALEGIR